MLDRKVKLKRVSFSLFRNELLMILTVASKGMLLKRGTGKNEKWEQNRKLEMKSLIGLSRVQVRFCSHFSFGRSPYLYPPPPVPRFSNITQENNPLVYITYFEKRIIFM